MFNLLANPVKITRIQHPCNKAANWEMAGLRGPQHSKEGSSKGSNRETDAPPPLVDAGIDMKLSVHRRRTDGRFNLRKLFNAAAAPNPPRREGR